MSWVANVMVVADEEDTPSLAALSEWYFRLWMLRDGELRQYAPTVPDENDEGFLR